MSLILLSKQLFVPAKSLPHYIYGGYSAAGQRARLWLWRPWVRIPVSTLESLLYHIAGIFVINGAFLEMQRKAQQNSGLSPSGKAQDFDSCIHQFESGQPSRGNPLQTAVCRGFCFFRRDGERQKRVTGHFWMISIHFCHSGRILWLCFDLCWSENTVII